MAVKRGVPGAALPALRQRRVKRVRGLGASARRNGGAGRSAQAAATVPGLSRRTNPVPEPPFWGTRIVKGIPLAEYAAYLDERATFMGQWGLKPSRKAGGPSYEDLVESEGRPRLRMWLERAQTEGLLQAAVVYGYFRCVSDGDDLIVLGETAASGSGSRSPASSATSGCAWPTSSGRARLGGDRRGGVPARHHGLGGVGRHRRAVRGQRLPRVPGAARPVRPAHRGPRRVLARAGARGARHREPRTRRTSTASSASSTRARATRSATPPARTWPTGPRSPGCSSRSASASSCRRRCSCTRSSPPTRSSSTTRRRVTSPSSPADRVAASPVASPAARGRRTRGRRPAARRVRVRRRTARPAAAARGRPSGRSCTRWRSARRRR